MERTVLTSFIDYAKAFDCVDHNKLWKIHKEMGIPDHLTCLLKICMQVKKQQLEPDMEQWTGSKLGKTVYFHPAYLTYMQSAAAAAAKSLQPCPTLCDPIDGSPSGSPIPGILQARTLEWVAISFSNA